MSAAVDESVVPARRVRHEVRDGLALMAFSLGTSVLVGIAMAFLVGLGK